MHALVEKSLRKIYFIIIMIDMSLEIFDRFLAAYTMGTHMLFTYWAIALPIFIVTSEYLAYRRNDPIYLAIAKRWSIVLAVLFAVGSASGAAIAVEFITAWYKWMYVVSQVDMLPFDIEVIAFFSEVIFLALYLYGWNRMSRVAHMVTGLLVGLGTAASAVLIILVNSWMNTPVGFDVVQFSQTGQITGVNPLATLLPPIASAEVPMGLAGAYFVGFGSLAGYFAFRLLRGGKAREYYSRGLKLSVYLVALDAIFLAWAGDNAGKALYSLQPLKSATLEGLIQTTSKAPMALGPLSIPGLLSLLVSWPPKVNAVVLGYSSFSPSVQDPLQWLAHSSYDVMAIIGILGALVFWVLGVAMLRRPGGKIATVLGLDRPAERKLPLYASFLMGWLQLVAWESGWVAAETAREPFAISGPMVQVGGQYTIQAGMLTSQAFNGSPEILPIGIAIIATLTLAVPGALYVLKRLFRNREITVDIEDSRGLLVEMTQTGGSS